MRFSASSAKTSAPSAVKTSSCCNAESVLSSLSKLRGKSNETVFRRALRCYCHYGQRERDLLAAEKGIRYATHPCALCYRTFEGYALLDRTGPAKSDKAGETLCAVGNRFRTFDR